MRLFRAFHDLGQHPAHVLGVEEEDHRPVRPDPGFSQHPRALGLEPRLGRANIGHLETYMMLPAERILLEERGDRLILPKRLDQLDLRALS